MTEIGLQKDGTLQLQAMAACAPLLAPSRYKGARGGRGGGKSHFFGELGLVRGVAQPGLRMVCIREVQISLKQSVKRLLEDKIQELGLGSFYNVMESEIRGPGDGLFIFQGMQNHTAESIKSLEGYDIAWVEEAQSLSEKSLRLLRPTLRKPNSELWFSWNPDQPDDPVENFFGSNPPDSILVDINHKDNPWFPEVLRAEMEHDFRVDPDAAAHTWNGEYWHRSHSQILHGKWRVEEFEPRESWDGPYYGCDWGFSVSPTMLIKMWINDRKLYIEYEAWGLGVDVGVATERLFETIPGISKQSVIWADVARPETISAQRKLGWDVRGAKKWAGSVEDGIEHLRSYDEIIIHPRCKHAIDDAKHYSYKVDRLTEEVLPEVVKKHDHTWDAGRYGLSPLIRTRSWRPIE